MEEDIKLVENLIEEYKMFGDLDGIQDIRPYMKAIENMLNRNKELEEKYYYEKNRARAELDTVYIKARYDERDKWTSKIKEKIKELNKAYEDSKDENGESEYYYPDYTIRVLQELLEKRK